MKILCVCAAGLSRSWALTYMLKRRGHDALPVGLDTNTAATFRMLCEWAEVILVTDNRLLERIPLEFSGKVYDYNVGPDRWNHKPQRDLIVKFDAYLEGAPWNQTIQRQS